MLTDKATAVFSVVYGLLVLPAGGRLVENKEAQIIRDQWVSPDFSGTLGIQSQFGRVFVLDEGISGGKNMVVLSHALWIDRLGGNPAIIGRRLNVRDRQVQVIEFPGRASIGCICQTQAD